MAKITVDLGLNTKGFVIGLDKIRGQVVGFAKALGQSMFGQFLGAAGVVALTRKLKSAFTDMLGDAKRWENLRDIFGGTTEYIQRLEMAAEDAGVSMGELKSTFGSLSKAREAAMQGKAPQLQAFASFGIGASELQSMSTTDIFERIRRSAKLLGTDSADAVAQLKTLGFTAAQIPLLLKDFNANDSFVVGSAELERMAKLEAAWTRILRMLKDIRNEAAAFWVEAAQGVGESAMGQKLNKFIDKIPGLRNIRNLGRDVGTAYFGGGDEDLPGLAQEQQRFLREKDRKREEEKVKAAKKEAEAAAAAAKTGSEKTKEEAKAVKNLKKESKSFESASTGRADTMAQIGARIGSSAMVGNPNLKAAQDQLQVQRSMDRKLADISNNTKSTSMSWS